MDSLYTERERIEQSQKRSPPREVKDFSPKMSSFHGYRHFASEQKETSNDPKKFVE